MKKLATILGIVAVLGSIIGGAIAYDRSKADVKIVLALELRFDQKILRDNRDDLRKEIRYFERKCNEDISKLSPDDRDKYKVLKEQLKDLEKELDKIKGGKG